MDSGVHSTKEDVIEQAVLDAEVRIGELMAQVPKASYDRGNQYTGGKTTPLSDSQTKTQVIEAAGFTPKQVQRFETLAKHPDLVAQAKAEARENDDIVSRSLVLEKVKAQVPKATGGQPYQARSTVDSGVQSKKDVIEQAGFTV